MVEDKFIESYKRRLEEELKSSNKKTIPYSDEYTKFRNAEVGRSHGSYESFCQAAYRAIRIKISDEQKQKIETAISLTHLNINAEGVVAFSQLMSIIIILSGTLLGFLVMFATGQLMATMITIFSAVIAGAGLLYYGPNIPYYILKRWRAKASDQLVLAIVYIVLYMKREQNLERAIHFVSKQIPPPLALDFMKVLWQAETGAYSSVDEALNAYMATWSGEEDEFVDSMHLVQATLYESSDEKAQDMLNKAMDIILDGVQEHMTHFAHNLQSPIRSLHMLGIVLPVMCLVMLPLVGTFMGVTWWQLVILFDIGIPLAVYGLAQNTVSLRPGGISKSDAYSYGETIKKSKGAALSLAMLIVFLFSIPSVLIITNWLPQAGSLTALINLTIFDPQVSDLSLYASIIFVMGLGLAVSAYYWFSAQGVIKLKRDVESIENQFSDAIFQLGNRIEEGVPTELAFSDVAEGTKGTKVSEFFSAIDFNLKVRGMGLKSAIFDHKVGAVFLFPSLIIKSIMNLIVEGAKKSQKAVAESLMTLSKYLRNIKAVSERLNDLLADTLSEMDMQAKYFTALITGIVVSLAMLIIRIVVALGNALHGIGTMGAGGGVEGVAGTENLDVITNVMSFFDASKAISPAIFQIIVGIYVILTVIILTFVVSRISAGSDDIECRWATAQNLFKSTILYGIIAFVASIFLSGLSKSIVNIALT